MSRVNNPAHLFFKSRKSVQQSSVTDPSISTALSDFILKPHFSCALSEAAFSFETWAYSFSYPIFLITGKTEESNYVAYP